MKHAGAAVLVYADYINFAIQGKVANTPFVSKWSNRLSYKVEVANPAEKCTLLAESPASSVPETMVYDVATNIYSYPTTGQFSKPSAMYLGEVPVVGATPGAIGGYGGSILLEDYWLPTTDCSKLKLTITSGEISGVSLVGKTITVSEHKLVEANKQYIVSVRLYFTDIYIYHDGSTGPLSKNPGKIPVAVLVSLPESGGSVGIALHDAKVGEMIRYSGILLVRSKQPVLILIILICLALKMNLIQLYHLMLQVQQYRLHKIILLLYLV
ncbi:hypothetical protein [Prevotella veroralis]|nr:hypothetical protein [Prevotella veroralis]QUB41242.1 hypothetical protein J5A55_03055 [Prevotella veroralis]